MTKIVPKSLTPIQVIVIRDRTDLRTDAYVELLRFALEGSDSPGNATGVGYFSEELDIGIPVLEPRSPSDSPDYRKALFGAAASTVIFEIRSRKRPKWPAAVKALLRKRAGTKTVPIVVPAALAGETEQHSPIEAGAIEPGMLPLITVLAVMEAIRDRLTQSTDSGPRAKFFISHAKIDGAPLALAITDMFRRTSTLFEEQFDRSYFYDAESIKRGDDWREALRTNAANGVLIALRTDAYADRYWCREEFQQAEANCMPIVVVELRKTTMEYGGFLNFDAATTIRISDGNLIRIVIHAIAAHVRLLKAQWRVSLGRTDVVVIPRHPSIASLSALLKDGKSGDLTVVYPGLTLPKERKGMLEDYSHKTSKRAVVLQSLAEWETP
ncbi:MAG: hypothetical protein AB8G17_07395 [Gammaproteobacteria bacterium]